MNALLIELTLDSPVLLSKVETGDANTAETQNYIPGSAIRGMLISRHLKGKPGTLQKGADFYELFFSGKLRFLNAYPCHGKRKEPARGLPAPLSLKADKDDEHTIYDLAIEERDSAELAKKGLDGFVSQDISVKVRTHKQMRVHIDRGNRKHIKDQQNAVFGYQSLSAGQIYQAVILGNADDLNNLKQMVDAMPNALLGKSSQAEYGRVGLKARIVSDWIEYKKRDEESDDKIWVTALSPWLIRDPKTGGYSSSPVAIFGVEHCPAVSFVRTEVVGGFNRAWGLPLPQQMAIQAGSVFAYYYSKELLEKIKAFEESGIGERTIEGFGRLAINWNTGEKIENFTVSSIVDDTSQSKTLTSISDQAKRIAERLWRSQLESELTKKINDTNFNLSNIPERAQLSRLRQVVLNALAENNPELVTKFLGGLKETAQRQYQRCRIGDERLKEWLDKNLSKTDGAFLTNLPTAVGGVNLGDSEISDIRTEFKLRYLAGVVHHMYKTKSQKTGDSHDNN